MTRPVASVLRVLGAGLVLLSLALLTFLWITRFREPEPWWRWALYALIGLAGVIVLATSGKIAERLTRDFEE